MIKASELRIGNWIFDPDRELLDGNGFRKVSAFSSNDEGMIHHTWGHSHSGNWATILQPIPLTPEILENCGFEKINDIGDFKKDIYTVMIREYNISISNNHGYIADIKFVHQLQNLYFSLTGEELQINLNVEATI